MGGKLAFASLIYRFPNSFIRIVSEELEAVTRKLERWYDVEVFVMHDEIRNLQLTANLPRYENMDKVLEIIEYAACVKFEVKGRTVVLRRD